MRYWTVCLGLVAGLACAAEPSASRGKVLYTACVACHGEMGVATLPEAPHLAHQPALAVTYQLIQFREGRRSGGGMEAAAAHLTDQEIRDISAYLTSLPPPPPEPHPMATTLAEGEKLVTGLYCNSCHGRQLEGQKHVPALAGQKSSYLEKQLKHFKSGERIDLDGSMENAVQSLTPEAIEIISAFSASHLAH